jgi:uncharacterized protein with HEPN domain
MPLEERDAAYLWDMLSAARKVVASLEGLRLSDYAANEDLRLTVERRIEIIGEAARRVSLSFRGEHPEIPWKPMMAQRNVLAHEYDEIDNERIWHVAVERLPQLIKQLQPLLPNPPPEPHR